MVLVDMPKPECCKDCRCMAARGIRRTCIITGRPIDPNTYDTKRAMWCPIVDTTDDKEDEPTHCHRPTFRDIYNSALSIFGERVVYSIDENHKIIFYENPICHTLTAGMFATMHGDNDELLVDVGIGAFEFVVKNLNAFCELTIYYRNKNDESWMFVHVIPVDEPIDETLERIFASCTDIDYLYKDFKTIFEGLKHLNFKGESYESESV